MDGDTERQGFLYRGVSLLEGTTAKVEESSKHLGIPQANGNLEQVTRKE